MISRLRTALHSRRPRAACTAALLCALALTLAAPPARAQRSFDESTDVLVVEIPVTVTQDGNPVRGLTKENFEVLDGRRKQEIVGFDVIDLSQVSAQAGSREALPTAGRRHFLFLFDMVNSSPTAITKARLAALEIARGGLHPQDLAAVAIHSLMQGPQLLLGFTPDRGQLELALDTLGNPDLAERTADPLALSFAEVNAAAGMLTANESLTSDQAAREELTQEYVESIAMMVGAADRDEQAGRVSTMTRQMAGLAQLMETIEGRKYVVYLSDGFDDSLLVGSGGDARSGGRLPQRPDAPTGPTAAESIAGGESYNVDSDLMYGSGDVQNDLQRVIQEFKKADCIVQAVDIGGLRAPGQGGGAGRVGDNVLSQLANDTGGQVYRNFNQLDEAMGQMLEKTSVTYLLAIQPDRLKKDGKYHRLKVKLNDAPRGAEASHRPGFYAPSEKASSNPFEQRLTAAAQLMDEEGGAIDTSVLATALQARASGADTRAYVPVLIEVNGSTLTAGLAGNALPVAIYAYALDGRGAVNDFFAQTLQIDVKQAGAQLKQTGLKYFGHLDLAPGQYDVRVLVRNLETGLSSLKVVPVTVPNFASGSPALSSPFFPEPMGSWLMIAEGEDRRADVPYPFLLGEQPFIPAAAPSMAKKGNVEIPILAFNFAEGDLTVSSRLRGPDGREVPGIKVAKVVRMPSSLPGASALVLHLEPGGLAPGDYELEVEVGSPGGSPASTTATVRVGG